MMKRYGLAALMLVALAVIWGCGMKESAAPATPAAPTQETVTMEKADGVSVLMYHMIGNIPGNDAVLREDLFRAQMQYLKDNGYHPITMAQLEAYIREDAPLPPKPVCITVDDGYPDTYTIIYPLLKEYGFPWTLFMIGGMADQPNRPTLAQLKEMRDNGVTIANHTWTHPELPYESESRQREEIAKTQAWLKEELGIDNHYFAYPLGLYDDTVKQVLQDNGITLAVTMNLGRACPGDELLEVKRIWIGDRVDMEHFVDRLTHDHYRSL